MKCSHCGYEIAETIKFCPNCGTPNLPPKAEPEPILEPVEDFQPAVEEPPVVEPPVKPASTYVPPVFPGEESPAKSKFPLWLLIMGGVVVLGLLVGAVLLFAKLLGGSGGDNILVAVPGKDNEAEVYVLKNGQELKDLDPMLENGSMDSSSIYQIAPDGKYYSLGSWGYSGGFVQNSNLVGLNYDEAGNKSLYLTKPNPKEITAIFESEDSFYALVLDNGKTVFIQEDRSTSERCYVSKGGKEAEQVAKGDSCTLAWVGGIVLTTEISSKGELTVLAYDLSSAKEVTLLEDEPNIRNNSFEYNPEGTQIVVTVEDGDQVKVKVISTRDGAVLAESDAFPDVLSVNTAYFGEVVYFIAETEEGGLELYTFEDGQQKLVASGYSILAQFDTTGKYLLYLAGDEENQQNLMVHPMKGGEDVAVLDGENLSFDLVPFQDTFIIQEESPEDEEVTLYSAKTDGSGLTKIYNEKDVYLNNIYYPKETDYLLIEAVNADNLSSLYAARFGSEDGDYILEDWSEISFFNINKNGNSLVMSGAEDSGDDTVLFTLDLSGKTDLVELDDDDIQSVVNAFFAANSRDILYTVKTGDNYDDVEIRQVPVTGKEDYETVYEETVLVGTSWATIEPFDYIWFSSPIQSSAVCPGAASLELDKTLTGQLSADVGELCYRFRAEADKEYTFFATGKDEQDLYLELLDKDGNYLTSDDDSGPGYNPSMYWTNGSEALTVFVRVSGNTSEAPELEVTAKEGMFNPGMASAVQLSVGGAAVAGMVDTPDVLELDVYSGAGDLYYFDGQANQTVIIDVKMDGTSSAMDPFVALVDSSLNILGQDDDSGTDVDASLTFTLPETGRYYILVLDVGNSSGPDYTYTVQVSQ